MLSEEFENLSVDEVLLPILNGTTQGMVVSSLDGKLVFWNEEASRVLNIPKESCLIKNVFELFATFCDEHFIPFSYEKFPVNITAETGVAQKDVIVVSVQGNKQMVWHNLNVTQICIGNTPFILTSFSDVSRIMEVNRKALENEKQLHLLVASLDDIVFEATAEGIILNYWVNDPQSLFYVPDYFLNKNIEELFPADLAISFLALIQNSLTERISNEMEYQSPFDSHKDNWYRIQTRPIRFMEDRVAVIVSDVTERIRREEMTRINEQKFNQAFQYSGIGMAMVNQEGVCLEVNKTLCKILGYTLAELTTLSFHEYTHPEDLEMDVQNLEKLGKGQLDSYTIEKRYRHKKGHYVWCLLTSSRVSDAKGITIFYIAQVQDISLSKKNVEILERQKNQLKTAMFDLETKIQQLEEFNKIVAHNLRGPVVNIKMLIQEILTAENENDKEEYLQLLQSSSDGLTEILQELIEILEIRNQQTIPFHYCDFDQIYNKVVQQFIVEIQTKEAVVTTDFEVKGIYYYRIYLESIMLNLISNALKYSVEGKRPHIHIRAYQDRNNVCLSFEDNGVGIDLQKYGNQVFKFRKTFHRGFDSKGVGLFMTRCQIESLGGKITVKSEPGNGSIFTVHFYLHQDVPILTI
ncbi:PAS domain S-box protein [Sphingobacterium spiritivorum]|uniref:PAS domain S-box protein n=1 Tax=Sphingobacterium spiritivorum TaxID=258 RepID=UPI00191B7DC8|nr:PAS domain S-box protein [Sphingobacterium spiritivorum]QQT24657.1 PAS domain S-box protein [Sphingobacterium spiritivorum]